jgi:hypothetical protein
MPQKVRQFCQHCNQVTTQVKKSKDDPWTCLCCESGKSRSAAEVEKLREKVKGRGGVNLKF